MNKNNQKQSYFQSKFISTYPLIPNQNQSYLSSQPQSKSFLFYPLIPKDRTRPRGEGEDRPTVATRPWSWRRSSSSTGTSPGRDASKSPTASVWPSGRSRSGFRTGGWKSRKRSNRSRNSTRLARARRAASTATPLATTIRTTTTTTTTTTPIWARTHPTPSGRIPFQRRRWKIENCNREKEEEEDDEEDDEEEDNEEEDDEEEDEEKEDESGVSSSAYT